MFYGAYSCEILSRFNPTYAKTRGANSELVTVVLMKFYITFVLYATEAPPLSNRTISMSDNCVSKATDFLLLLVEITFCLFVPLTTTRYPYLCHSIRAPLSIRWTITYFCQSFTTVLVLLMLRLTALGRT